MALRSRDMQSSATATLGKVAARGPGSTVAAYTASGARAPSAAAAQSSKPLHSSRLAPLGPSQNTSYQNTSRQSSIRQPTIDETSATVYTSRGTTKIQADYYRPSYNALPERNIQRNIHFTNRSQRSYNGNGASGEHGQRLPISVYKPGSHPLIPRPKHLEFLVLI